MDRKPISQDTWDAFYIQGQILAGTTEVLKLGLQMSLTAMLLAWVARQFWGTKIPSWIFTALWTIVAGTTGFIVTATLYRWNLAEMGTAYCLAPRTVITDQYTCPQGITQSTSTGPPEPPAWIWLGLLAGFVYLWVMQHRRQQHGLSSRERLGLYLAALCGLFALIFIIALFVI